VAGDRRWLVRLLQMLDFVIGKLEVRDDSLIQALDLQEKEDELKAHNRGIEEAAYRAKAHDRAGNLGVDPCKADLSHAPALLLAELLDATKNLSLPVLILSTPPELFAVLKAQGLLACRTSELAAAERTPGDDTDAVEFAVCVHLALLLAVEEVVLVLHADELGPTVLKGECKSQPGKESLRNTYLLGDVVVVGELPGPHRTSTDIADLSTRDKVVQSLHSLLRRGVGKVGPVDLEQVDIRGVKPLERGLNLIENRSTGETTLVDVIPVLQKVRHGVCNLVDLVVGNTPAFGQDDETVTRYLKL
jgi:hypothetical protein